MAAAVGESPGKELFDDGFAGRTPLDHLADLFVDPGYGNEYGRFDGGDGGGYPLEAATVSKGCAVTKQRVVEMASSDVGEGQKGDAGGIRVPIEGPGGVIEVGSDVAVGEHDSLGLTGGAGGVDESG